jgi:hypothetical protein
MANRTDAQIQEHIRLLAARTPAEADVMLEMLRRGCWPVGPGDRSDARVQRAQRRSRRRPGRPPHE